MINVSSIKQHMYCPMQLYIKNHIDTSERENYRLAIEITDSKKHAKNKKGHGNC